MIMRYCCTEDFVLPVCIGITEESVLCAVLAIHIFNICAIFVTAHNVISLLLHADGCASCIRNSRLLAFVSLLCRDNDDTVRTTATIDCCCRSILQHVEALNILRIDHRQRVRKTFHTIIVHRHTVDNDKRVITCRQ